MNISQATIKKLESEFLICFSDESLTDNVSPAEATRLCVVASLREGAYIGKEIKAAKKEITYSYVIEKIGKCNVYKSFAESFNSLLQSLGVRAYATTYGIGIEAMFRSDSQITAKQLQICSLLDSINVKYRCEYSEAHYIFRFIISKSVENIGNIEKFVNSI